MAYFWPRMHKWNLLGRGILGVLSSSELEKKEKTGCWHWCTLPCAGWSCSSNFGTMSERPSDSRRSQLRHYTASELTLAAKYLLVCCYGTESNPHLFKLLWAGFSALAAEAIPGCCTHHDTNGSGHMAMVTICQPQFRSPAENSWSREESMESQDRAAFTKPEWLCSTLPLQLHLLICPIIQLLT